MRIEELHIQNFRGFKDLTLKFPSNMTVLIGVNGSGKSSILDCLSILMADLSIEVAKFIEPYKFVASGYTHPNLDFFPVFDQWDINNQAQRSQIALKLIFDGQEQSPVTLELERGTLRKQNNESSARFFQFLLERLHTNNEANIPFSVYYKCDRSIHDVPLQPLLLKLRYEQLNVYDSALNGKQVDFKDFFMWFRTEEDLEQETRLDSDNNYRSKALEAVREGIALLLPGFTDLQVKRSRMEMTLKKHGEELIINQLSDGEKNLLAMIGDLARRLAIANPSLKNPLQGSGIVLIDEIELHLHPQWQRRIIPALTQTFPNLQFIVTTHSPQVLSNVKKENVFILEDFKLVENTPYTYGRDSNSILYELMGVEERIPEIKQELDACFDLIDRDEIEKVKEKLQELSKKLGQNDPEIIRANTLIDFFHRIG